MTNHVKWLAGRRADHCSGSHPYRSIGKQGTQSYTERQTGVPRPCWQLFTVRLNRIKQNTGSTIPKRSIAIAGGTRHREKALRHRGPTKVPHATMQNRC